MLNKGIRSDLASDAPIYSFSDEQTKRKIKRHLTDINDIITDKDIKDAKVPGTEGKNRPIAKKEGTRKAKSPGKPGKTKNIVDDTPGNPPTPWDVLDK